MEYHNVQKYPRDSSKLYQVPERQFDNFSNEDSIYKLWQDDPEIKKEYKNISKYFQCLHPEDQKLIKLYYYKQKTQKQISKKLKINQASVCNRLKKVRAQIYYLIMLEKIKSEMDAFQEDLSPWLGEIDRALLLTMMQSPGITVCVKKMKQLYPAYKGWTYTRVRYRWGHIKRTLLRELPYDPGLNKYRAMCDMIDKNYNCLNFQRYYDTHSAANPS